LHGGCLRLLISKHSGIRKADTGKLQPVTTFDPFGYLLLQQGKVIEVGNNLSGLYGNPAGMGPHRNYVSGGQCPCSSATSTPVCQSRTTAAE
jgi:hypothetical protein